MTITELATALNTTEANAREFLSCLAIWTRKGYTVEQAIEKHMSQMQRFMDAAVEKASTGDSRSFRALRDFMGAAIHNEMRA